MAKPKIKFLHIGVAIIPVALTPALIYALAEGWIDLGGGEKDIIAAFPYFILTFTFLVVSIILILKRWRLREWMLRSSVVSISILICLGVAAYWLSWLGIA